MANIIKIGYYYTPVEFPNISLFGRNEYIGEVSYDVKQSFPDINKDVRQLAEAKILISDSIPLRREDFPKNRDDFLVSLVNFDEFSKILFNKQKKIKKIDPNYDKQLERHIKNNRIIKSNLIMYIKEIFKPLTELEINTNQNVKNNQIYTIVNDWNFLFKPYDSSSDFKYLESIMYDYNLNKALIKDEQKRKKIRDVVSYVTKRKEHAFLSYYVEYIDKNANDMAFYIDERKRFTLSETKNPKEKNKEKGEANDDDDDDDDDDDEEGIGEDIDDYNKWFKRIIVYLRRKQGMTFPNVNPNDEANKLKNAFKMYEYAENKKKEKKEKDEKKEEQQTQEEEKEKDEDLKLDLRDYPGGDLTNKFSDFIFAIEPLLQDYRRSKSTRSSVQYFSGDPNDRRSRTVEKIMELLLKKWFDKHAKDDEVYYSRPMYKTEYSTLQNTLSKLIEPLMHWITTTEYEDYKRAYELSKNEGESQPVYSINIYKNPSLLKKLFTDLVKDKGDKKSYEKSEKFLDEKMTTQYLFKTITDIYNRNYVLRNKNESLFYEIIPEKIDERRQQQQQQQEQEQQEEDNLIISILNMLNADERTEIKNDNKRYGETNEDTNLIFYYIDELLLKLENEGILKYHGTIHMDYNNEPIIYEKKNGNKYEVIKYGDLWDLLKIEKKQSSADERKRRDMMYRNHTGILDDRARRSYYSSDIADNLETYQITLEKAFALKLDYRDTKEIEIAYQNNKCQVQQVSDIENSLKNVKTAWFNRKQKLSDLIKDGSFGLLLGYNSNTRTGDTRAIPVTKKKIKIKVETEPKPMNRTKKRSYINFKTKDSGLKVSPQMRVWKNMPKTWKDWEEPREQVYAQGKELGAQALAQGKKLGAQALAEGKKRGAKAWKDGLIMMENAPSAASGIANTVRRKAPLVARGIVRRVPIRGNAMGNAMGNFTKRRLRKGGAMRKNEFRRTRRRRKCKGGGGGEFAAGTYV